MVAIRFVPYSEIENLSSVGRIRKLLNMAKEKKIVILQGRLKKEEEKELIKTTMEEINRNFKGIELAVIYPTSKNMPLASQIKTGIVNTFLGDMQGFTVVGPANMIKGIKRDPSKIELWTKEGGKSSKRRR